MSVHYKFKSALDYDTVTFDGLHISVGDLKAAISQQKRIGKTSDFDLEITNAQTKEVYVDDHTLIPKNTSLLVARVPQTQQPKKQWESSNSLTSSLHKDAVPNKGVADLSRMEGSEQDKINAMISQSTFDYDPSNYQKIRGQNQRGAVPPNYTCYKCQKRGHWIKDCPAVALGEPVEIRRSTGIPRSFMVPVEGPKAPGAMMTPSGTFAVPAVDRDAYLASENAGGGDTPANAPADPDTTIPDELICSLCRDLLTDAVMIPCCGNSFCDECIRGALLESEDHECPDCREKEIAPTTLIPNRFLRNSVSSFRNQTGYSRRMPHRPAAVAVPQPQPDPAVMHGAPPNGPGQLAGQNPAERRRSVCEESDGSGDDGVTVTLPPAHAHLPRPARPHPRPHPHPHPRPHRLARYGQPPHILKHAGLEGPPNVPIILPPRIDEQRASTPTVDERRDPIAQPAYSRRPLPGYAPAVPPPTRPYNNAPAFGRPALRPSAPPFNEHFPRALRNEPFQPPPPGIKDSPNGHSEDPLEAFNRMIREKEMRAKRREEERRRAVSGSRSPRSRSPRSPRAPRLSRSPRAPRSSRSPRPPRSPRLVRSPRSPRTTRSSRSPRSPRSPRMRARSRGSSRLRYSRSRSMSRSHVRRSPWSPRRRRTREITLSLTRSPSPRRRHRSPLRYRSPLRSPARSPARSPPRSPARSPPRDAHRPLPRSPPPRPLSPHRYAGVYDELLSPPRRNVEPPYGPRYGPRNSILPPTTYPPMGTKVIPPLMSNLGLPTEQPPGYRGRYDGPPPPFEDVPPGVEPPVPGFEPPAFEKPLFGPPGTMDRERLPPPNYRDSYIPRQPYGDGPGGYREMPIPSLSNEIPVHVGDPPRFRDNYRPGPPSYREGPTPQFREGQVFRDQVPQVPYRDPNYRGALPPFRDGPYRNVQFREPGFRETAPHSSFRDGPSFRPPATDTRDPRDPVPPNFHDPNFRDGYRDDGAPRDHARPGYRPSVRNRGGPRRIPNVESDRHREREGHERERYNEARETERIERSRDPDKRGRDGRTREHDRSRDIEKEKDQDRISPDRKNRGSPKRNKEMRDKKRSESRGRSRERDRDGRKEKKEERNHDKSSAERNKDHKEKEKKMKDRKKKKREKEKDGEKKKKRDKKEKKDKENIKKEDGDGLKIEDDKNGENEQTQSQLEQNIQEVQEQNELAVSDESSIKKDSSPKAKSESKPPDDLYGDEISEAVDKEILQNYVKTEESDSNDKNADTSKEEPFDGIELQANVEELDLKPEPEPASKEMLAPLPELSKWEVDEDNTERSKEPGEITSPEEEEDGGKVTSDVIKRAENAIFAKAINSLRPIEIKKISNDRVKLYSDESAKTTMNNIQITVPIIDLDQRSVEINEKKKRYSKTPPPRLSVKERLGGKVDDQKRIRESRLVQSTVERVKSRSKTPKKEQPYRRVTVEKEKGRKQNVLNRPESSKAERRVVSETVKSHGKHRARSPRDKRVSEKQHKDDRRPNKIASSRNNDKNASAVLKNNADRERKKSTLDESHFEPDYDENVDTDNEIKDETMKKRERSASPMGNEVKKPKVEHETIKLDLANVKKKPDSESESTSDSDESSSSSSEDARKRSKKKKKRNKKKKKRAASDSESDSGSSTDDHKKKKKKRKHKKKSSKKKSKKSKHK